LEFVIAVRRQILHQRQSTAVQALISHLEGLRLLLLAERRRERHTLLMERLDLLLAAFPGDHLNRLSSTV